MAGEWKLSKVEETKGSAFQSIVKMCIRDRDTPGGVAWNKIADVKHEQLPQVVMAKDFDAAWDTYMDAYNACHPEDFISELQTELDTRMEHAAKFK